MINNSSTLKLLKEIVARPGVMRLEMVTAMTDFFLPRHIRLTDQQRSLMYDILSKIIAEIELDIRRHLGEVISRIKMDAGDLNMILTHDQPQAAMKRLEATDLLRCEQLIEIIRIRTEEHRFVLKLKASSDDKNSDQESDPLEKLMRHEDQALGRRVMEYLITESKRYDRFQEPLILRDDLPETLLTHLYWWTAVALRYHIIEEYNIPEQVVDHSIQESTRNALGSLSTSDGAGARASRLSRHLSRLGLLDEEFLRNCLKHGRMSLFASTLGEMAEISDKMIWRILTDRDCYCFMVIARALNFSEDFTQMVLYNLLDTLTQEAEARPESFTERLDFFKEITNEQAMKVLSYWQRDPNYQQALDEFGYEHRF